MKRGVCAATTLVLFLLRLTLKGGYNAGFTLDSGVTAVKGKLVIRNGTLRVNHVALI